MSSSLRTVKQFALAYLGIGCSLIPVHSVIVNQGAIKCSCGSSNCTAIGKHPIGNLVPQGVKQASSDPNVINTWFKGIGQKNVGIATGKKSGIAVLDIDPRHGGADTLRALEEKHGPLPKTLCWNTGGGGQHIIFKYPECSIGNSVGKLGPGIDVRGDGGYIVAPPSRHSSGNYYSLPNGQSLDMPLALPPPWLLSLMKQEGGNALSNKPPIKQIVREAVPEGQRNSTIARISGHLLAKCVDARICLDLMLAFNEKYCMPPLSDQEVMRTVASINSLALKKFTNVK